MVVGFPHCYNFVKCKMHHNIIINVECGCGELEIEYRVLS